jgi:hypothetical protein
VDAFRYHCSYSLTSPANFGEEETYIQEQVIFDEKRRSQEDFGQPTNSNRHNIYEEKIQLYYQRAYND